MRRMGVLRKLMPITAVTFIVGWLAIAGVPPFAGFWSKDEILLFALDKSPVLYVVGLVTALLTAYYMTRQVIMVFFGKARWEDRADEHGAHGDFKPHESPWIMLIPLVVLAGLSIVGGLIKLPSDVTPTSSSSPRALARAGRRVRRGATSPARGADDLKNILMVDRHRRRGARHRRRLARVPAQAGQGRSSRRSSPTAGTTTRPSASSWAGPGARRSRRRLVRRQRRRRRGQRRGDARARPAGESARPRAASCATTPALIGLGVVAAPRRGSSSSEGSS